MEGTKCSPFSYFLNLLSNFKFLYFNAKIFGVFIFWLLNFLKEIAVLTKGGWLWSGELNVFEISHFDDDDEFECFSPSTKLISPRSGEMFALEAHVSLLKSMI